MTNDATDIQTYCNDIEKNYTWMIQNSYGKNI